MSNSTERLPVLLYHGTSTIFLDGIINSGLGGRNQLAEWKVFELAKVLYPLVHEHLATEPDWMLKVQSFGYMAEQRSSAMNFQHGDTYLSPSALTAVRYAVDKRYGSELLSYTLDFLQELLRRKVPSVADELYRKHRDLFHLLDVSCAPLLIGVEGAHAAELASEDGGDPGRVLNHVLSTLKENGENAELLQQSNFRLRGSIPIARLRVWLVNVTRWNPYIPEYSLHMLRIPGTKEDAREPHAPDRLQRASPLPPAGDVGL